jgi:hypothetical protein
MTSSSAIRELPWVSPLVWIALLASVALLGIGIRAVLAPASAASGFGIPLSEGSGLAFVQAFGARNIGLSLFALLAIILDERRSVGVLFLCAAAIAAIDALILGQHLGIGPTLIRPAAISAALLIIGGFLLR